ncbi:DUF1214 domain-containing protein [Spongiibacter sp. KMU-166]|uniref:DUF1214 domain-containing protein n=1 Tax=Spongiibacter thalassae TaxID=2721624 RepID=A0ABX1GCA6_9GAMM|nr:DUF1214 domain-containing protein [Spongiibacter thalassae]NKI16047.1 DUF1214 domain-containing protein [Spongiibacter thalassae]
MKNITSFDEVGSKCLGATDVLDLNDPHFLSPNNHTATLDQKEIEELALEMMSHPRVLAAKQAAARRWRMMCTDEVPSEAWVSFEKKMEEWTFHYLLLAINGDSNYPKVLDHGYGPPHNWFGMDVPGCRGPGTAENPDNNYSWIPVDGRSHFELHGKLSDKPVGECPFHIVGNLSMGMNLACLDWQDVEIDEDGNFVITISPEPANGRKNHIQTMINARYIFVRASRVNWDQKPHALRIKRVTPPTAPPQSIDQIAELANRYIIDDISENFWFHRMVACVDINTCTEPETTTFFGGMAIQKLARGHLKLNDNEAFVLTLKPGGSKYFVTVLYDYWLMSGNYWSRQSTLNNDQSIANEDGSYTYVFSLKDPGVHNWIDMLDTYEPLFMIRLNQLPQTKDHDFGETEIHTQVVKLCDLKDVLPKETKWVSPEEREQALSKRLEQFNNRYVV